jgi:hypothetical protein
MGAVLGSGQLALRGRERLLVAKHLTVAGIAVIKPLAVRVTGTAAEVVAARADAAFAAELGLGAAVVVITGCADGGGDVLTQSRSRLTGADGAIPSNAVGTLHHGGWIYRAYSQGLVAK